MKKLMYTVAAVAMMSVSPAMASNVTSTYGNTNLGSTDWETMDCNGYQTILQCTLNGGEGDGGPDKGAGDSDNSGKH